MVITQEKVFIRTSTSPIWNKTGKGMNFWHKLMVFHFVFFKMNFTIILQTTLCVLENFRRTGSFLLKFGSVNMSSNYFPHERKPRLDLFSKSSKKKPLPDNLKKYHMCAPHENRISVKFSKF